MKKLIFLLVSSLLTFNNAYALRCNHKLVRLGDYKPKVIHICGEPDYVDTRYEAEATELRDPNFTLELTKVREIVIDEWTYNFGTKKLMRRLTFRNGILVAIDALGYGY